MQRAILGFLLLTAPVLAHGGQFGGPGRGGVPPGEQGLPGQPTKPARTGNLTHVWQTWWGYNQFKYLDFRRRQKERRGPVSGTAMKTNPDAWRTALRVKLEPVFVAALKDDDKEVRTAAAVALGKISAVGAIPALKDLIEKDNVQEAREAALQGLTLMGEPQLREFFIDIARKRSEKLRLRGFALMGLGRIGDTESKQFLLDLFDRKNKQARSLLPKSTGDRREFLVVALNGLLLTKDASLAPFFLGIAKSKRNEEDVRAYAVTCVGKMKATDRLPDVIDILAREGSDQVRRSAAVAIGALAPRADAVAVKALSKALAKDKDKVTRHFATISLGQIGGEIAFQTLVRRYDRANKEARGFFLLAFGLSRHEGAAKHLKKTLEGAADANEAGAAAIGFGLLEDKKYAPVVRKRFQGAKAWILLQTTVLALGMLNDVAASEDIRDVVLTRRQPGMRVSAAIAYALLQQRKAVPLFTGILQHASSTYVLNSLTQVMGYLASESAAPPLEEIYNDKKVQRQARAYALVALGALCDPEDFPLLRSLAFDTNYFVRCDPLDEAVTIL